MSEKISIMKTCAAIYVACAFTACASHYRFISQPQEANVFYVNGNQKTLLGQTPIDYTKTALPNDAPFMISFEKSGFEPKEVSVAPSDNTLTQISVGLKPDAGKTSDESIKRIRKIVQQIFSVQELTAKRRYVDALATLKDLEKDEPSLPEVPIMRGSIYVLLSDKKSALDEWNKALKADPENENLKVLISRLMQGVGDAAGGRP